MNEKNLTITQGDEKAYNLTFSTAGVAQDITDATVKMTVRRTRNSGEALISKVVTTHTDPTEGKTTITLSPTDTAIDLGAYYYDIQISGGGIGKKTVMKGELTITWQVTED